MFALLKSPAPMKKCRACRCLSVTAKTGDRDRQILKASWPPGLVKKDEFSVQRDLKAIQCRRMKEDPSTLLWLLHVCPWCAHSVYRLHKIQYIQSQFYFGKYSLWGWKDGTVDKAFAASG